ncbi:hypothetical protein [Amycolatopsis lexingtonensis]|uniref:hypothetical protein n=1 Tax=Amycolatopsis lexingtonensis TaxID=218822 RepID=UPI003F70B033
MIHALLRAGTSRPSSQAVAIWLLLGRRAPPAAAPKLFPSQPVPSTDGSAASPRALAGKPRS